MDIMTVIGILFAWNAIGFVIYAGIQLHATWGRDDYQLLNPCEIYELWNVNYFGCALLTLVLNLLCPIWSIIYWFVKLMRFICTIGRR